MSSTQEDFWRTTGKILDREVTEELEFISEPGRDFAAEIIASFIKQYPELLIQCKQFLRSNNIDAARKTLHTLKGSAGSVGAKVVLQAAQELEYAARQGDMVTIHIRLPELEQKLQDATEALNLLLQNRQFTQQ